MIFIDASEIRGANPRGVFSGGQMVFNPLGDDSPVRMWAITSPLGLGVF